MALPIKGVMNDVIMTMIIVRVNWLLAVSSWLLSSISDKTLQFAVVGRQNDRPLDNIHMADKSVISEFPGNRSRSSSAISGRASASAMSMVISK
jgi:hypothetical protein